MVVVIQGKDQCNPLILGTSARRSKFPVKKKGEGAGGLK